MQVAGMTDAIAYAFCKSLPSPLREDVACILQWDHNPSKMPKTKALAKIYGIPPPRQHATPEDTEQALREIGYANPKSRVANPTIYVQMMRDARRRHNERKRAEVRRLEKYGV